MKYKVGDYIRYTPSQERYVIDSLLDDDQGVYNEKLEGYNFSCFFLSNKGEWVRCWAQGCHNLRRNITDEFFDHANSIKTDDVQAKDENFKSLETSRGDQYDEISRSILSAAEQLILDVVSLKNGDKSLSLNEILYRWYCARDNVSFRNCAKDPDFDLNCLIEQKEKVLAEMRVWLKP